LLFRVGEYLNDAIFESRKNKVSLKNHWIRILAVLITLSGGAFLILSQKTLFSTSLGIVLWAVSTGLVLGFIPKMPGTLIFSHTPLRHMETKTSWPWPILFLIGALILYALKNSDALYKNFAWGHLTLVLLGIGFLFFILEKTSSAFQVKQAPSEIKAGWPWPEILIILVGSFFLFYQLNKLPNFIIIESLYTIGKANDFTNGLLTTPFMDQWQGNPLFPSFLLSFIFKFIGVSYLKGAIFFASLNIFGFIFFYRFLRFYIAQESAAITALLFSSSHWLIFYARMPLMGGGIIVAFEAAALYFFAKALEEGKIKDFVGFGIALALTLDTYIASRLVLIFFVVAVLYIGISRRKEITQQKIGWAMGWGCLLLWTIPMIFYYIHTSNNNIMWAERVDAVNIFDRIRAGNWAYVKDNINMGLCMMCYGSCNEQILYYPYLSAWEGLCFLAGIGWCLWRFFNPAFFILFIGYFGGIAGSILTIEPAHALRAITAAPFAFVFVGIGLDRLGRLIGSPLKSARAQKGVQYLFFILFLCFSLARHYDIYFRMLPKSSLMFSKFDGDSFLMAQTVPQYPAGWDIYIAPHYLGFPFTYFSNNGDIGKIGPFPLRHPFPLKTVSPKGAVIILPVTIGIAFENWISYYYPKANYRAILNPYGDVEFKLWEITPDEVQEALKTKNHNPPTGLNLSWYDAKKQKLGQWLVPALFSTIPEWFSYQPSEPGTSFNNIAYYVAKGSVRNPEGGSISLETTCSLDANIGIQKIEKHDFSLKQIQFSNVKNNWVPLQIHFSSDPSTPFHFDLQMRDASGLNLIPTGDLQPSPF
jgi:hypothetical protein